MIKIRRKLILLTVFIIVVIFLISSCAKPECIASSDCISKTCSLPTCENGKCAYKEIANCCGNRIKENIEDGKPGNQCTCPQDYGKCEGKGKVNVGARAEDAVYVKYYCNADNQCVFGVDKKDIAIQNFPDSINIGYFKASSVIKYNKPFDAGRDSFEFRISLDDVGKELVLPIVLTKIKLLYIGGSARVEQLIAEKDLSNILNGIGDKTTINLPITLGYKPQELEEAGSIRYAIDYSYKIMVPSGRTSNGTTIYSNETKRDTFTAPTKPVFLAKI